MRNNIFTALVLCTLCAGCGAASSDKSEKAIMDDKNLQVATFAGGCFWCMEPPYDGLPGVVSTVVGYAGGETPNPTYEQVSTGTTGHLEAVQVTFDSSRTTYEELLAAFWRNIDPVNPYGQFADIGSQYRTAIFYHNEEQKIAAEKSKKELQASSRFDKPIATEIRPITVFYPAEEYHQEYYKKHPLRYNSYKVGSGRAGFIKEIWGEENEK